MLGWKPSSGEYVSTLPRSRRVMLSLCGDGAEQANCVHDVYGSQSLSARRAVSGGRFLVRHAVFGSLTWKRLCEEVQMASALKRKSVVRITASVPFHIVSDG
jgi:hypothetical protein